MVKQNTKRTFVTRKLKKKKIWFELVHLNILNKGKL